MTVDPAAGLRGARRLQGRCVPDPGGDNGTLPVVGDPFARAAMAGTRLHAPP